jgi:hypothetical protein
MSDDYHDDDSRGGGLWDPDALSPPPAPRRPALHAVPSPESHDVVGLRDSELVLEDERLVRLDQFRPVPEDDDRLAERASARVWRRAMMAAAAALAIAATIAMGVGSLTSDHGHPPKPRALATATPDVEQAAVNRNVKSAASRPRGGSRTGHRAAHRSTASHPSSKAHRDTSAAPAQTTLVSQGVAAPLATSNTTKSASPPPAKAQRATASCEFPPC